MTMMGQFYSDDPKGAPVNCKGVFVYADKDQRTLYTARALVEGLCGSPDAVPIFHEKDMSASDPIFNAMAWFAKTRGIDVDASKLAVAAVAGSPPSTIVMWHAEEFSTLQRILDTRCG